MFIVFFIFGGFRLGNRYGFFLRREAVVFKFCDKKCVAMMVKGRRLFGEYCFFIFYLEVVLEICKKLNLRSKKEVFVRKKGVFFVDRELDEYG